MQRPTTPLSGMAMALTLATPALGQMAASSTSLTSPAQLYLRVFGPANAPDGFTKMCERTPQAPACTPSTKVEFDRFEATPERLAELDGVNRTINVMVKPATDAELYGTSEYWAYPTDRGDCEDYALLKQKVLEARGWPKSALLMTVAVDEKGEGHAILTARTAQGDFVLDNKVDEVKFWNETGYFFIMRQSYIDHRLWVSLMPPPDAAQQASTQGR